LQGNLYTIFLAWGSLSEICQEFKKNSFRIFSVNKHDFFLPYDSWIFS